MKKTSGEVSLDDLLDNSTYDFDTRDRSLLTRVTAWVGVVLAASIGVGAMVAPGAVAVSAAGTAAISYWDGLPTELPLDQALPQHTVLLDKDGKEFARFFSENRVDVALKDISPHFIDALIATEDSRFRTHGGMDPVGIMRAFASNAGGGGRQGASTITQQLVQNVLLNNARNAGEEAVAAGDTYGQKLREIRFAVALEDQYTKDEILTAYSNAVYFGNGAYGVQAASRIYFDTSAKDLTASQAATLVGVLRGPAIYDPVAHPESALARRNTVISRLEAVGSLTAQDAEQAMDTPLVLKRGKVPSGCAESDYPYYCSMVRTEILTDPAFGETPEERAGTLTRGGMTLTTALNRKAMNVARKSVTDTLGNENRAALGVAVIVPGTGHVAAIAQNRTWGSGPGQTEIIYANRAFQPGSSMKPIVLATGLEQGIPASTRMSAPSHYRPAVLDAPDGGFSNYDFIDWGTIDGRKAIGISSNTYFIKLIERTGVLAVADMAERLGITSIPRTGPSAITGREASLALGAYEISPLEMATAYAAFAGNGVVCAPVTIVAGTRSSTGDEIAVPDPGCHQEISPAVADTVADALKEPLREGGTLGGLGGVQGREAGVKTGTTNGYAANWTVGVTPRFATAVWLGDPRGGQQYPLTSVSTREHTYYNLTGSEIAAPVWKKIMDGMSAGLKPLAMPDSNDVATSVPSGRTVPDVRGMGAAEAGGVLGSAGIGVVVEPDTVPAETDLGPGVVTSQTPAPGSTLGRMSEVRISLSPGSDTSVVIERNKP